MQAGRPKSPRFRLDRTRALWLCAFAAIVAGIILWGGLQPEDPLSPLVRTDKMRHVLGFSALGLLAAMAPSARSRLAGMIAACAFALSLELIQHFTPDRTMSGRDFVASCIGVCAGMGLGAALTTTLELVRDWAIRRSSNGGPPRG